MGQISKNFNMAEFAASAIADRTGISNAIPADKQVKVRILVNRLLQPLCDLTGWSDKITSGYRSPEINRLAGGVITSQHLRGEASDNVFYNRKETDTAVCIATIDVLRAVRDSGLDFDQMIAYPTFVHLSLTIERMNRRQILYASTYKGERL